jgi:hypothetical protein
MSTIRRMPVVQLLAHVANGVGAVSEIGVQIIILYHVHI